MSTEFWILGSAVLVLAITVLALWLALSGARDELHITQQTVREYRDDYYGLREDYWKLGRRLNDLGHATGHVYREHDAYRVWEKQS